jgi:hypothetical protein
MHFRVQGTCTIYSGDIFLPVECEVLEMPTGSAFSFIIQLYLCENSLILM